MKVTEIYMANLIQDIARVTAECQRASMDCPLWKMLCEQKSADYMLCQSPKRITVYANRHYGPASHIYSDVKQCCVPCAEQYHKEVLKAEICRDCKLHQVQK
jgi:hypothetical protein